MRNIFYTDKEKKSLAQARKNKFIDIVLNYLWVPEMFEVTFGGSFSDYLSFQENNNLCFR